VDEITTHCGFRYFRFDPDSGFYLNGKHLKIKGVCNHIDHAGVGVAVPDAIWEFRLRKIKEMGANAYRCSHNPPSREFLDLCDSMGILVMAENRNFNASPEYLRQLEWMVRRDRNHPSIILWSVFNEEPMQGTEQGYEMVRRMSVEVKKLDTTRPVTAAMNGGFQSIKSVAHAVDVAGFNYQIYEYDRFHKANPTIPLTSSEDASGVMMRDNYVTNASKNLLDAYDTQSPPWGATHRNAWKEIDSRPYLAGCFIWTGFDYHGEPTPYAWPTVSSSFGIMDLCGFPKTAYWLHQAQWIQDKDILHVVPHWNWPTDSIGKPIKVMALSNADRVKLFLNGKLIGEKQNDKYEMVSWEVPYQPGKLVAIGYKNAKQVSTFKVETTGQAVSLELLPDRNMLKNEGQDAMPITVRALDAKGRPVTVCNEMIEFEVSGSVKIIGLGNGDPNSHESEKGNKRSLFNGLAQIIIQSVENGKAGVTLTAKAKGLKPASINIPLQVVEPIAAVIPEEMNKRVMNLNKWSLSPEFTERPNPLMKVADNDMNSWRPINTGQLSKVSVGKYVILRCSFTRYKQQQTGGKIVFENIFGIAEIWLNDKKLAEKTKVESADLSIDLPAESNKYSLNILIRNPQSSKLGLEGEVRVIGNNSKKVPYVN
jgi:beta-galactosidase